MPSTSDPTTPPDLDAWLDDVTLPEVDVTIYARADLAAEHERLTVQLQTARAADDQVDEDNQGIDHGAAVTALEQQRADALTAMRASARTFRLHGLTQEATNALVVAATDEKRGKIDGDLYTTLAVGACADLTPEQVAKLRARLPLSQWLKLSEATNRILAGEVSLPF